MGKCCDLALLPYICCHNVLFSFVSFCSLVRHFFFFAQVSTQDIQRTVAMVKEVLEEAGLQVRQNAVVRRGSPPPPSIDVRACGFLFLAFDLFYFFNASYAPSRSYLYLLCLTLRESSAHGARAKSGSGRDSRIDRGNGGRSEIWRRSILGTVSVRVPGRILYCAHAPQSCHSHDPRRV